MPSDGNGVVRRSVARYLDALEGRTPRRPAHALAGGTSPWGPHDDLGRLNLMTPESRARILGRIAGGATYDLSVDYFIGMPSWQAAGDPHYRMWMTHTPHGTVVDDPLGVGREMNDT